MNNNNSYNLAKDIEPIIIADLESANYEIDADFIEKLEKNL